MISRGRLGDALFFRDDSSQFVFAFLRLCDVEDRCETSHEGYAIAVRPLSFHSPKLCRFLTSSAEIGRLRA